MLPYHNIFSILHMPVNFHLKNMNSELQIFRPCQLNCLSLNYTNFNVKVHLSLFTVTRITKCKSFLSLSLKLFNFSVAKYFFSFLHEQLPKSKSRTSYLYQSNYIRISFPTSGVDVTFHCTLHSISHTIVQLF